MLYIVKSQDAGRGQLTPSRTVVVSGFRGCGWDMNDDISSEFQNTTLDDLIELAKQRGAGSEETVDDLVARQQLVPREHLVDALERSERLEVLVTDAMELVSTVPHEFRSIWHDWLEEAKSVIVPSSAN